MAVTEPIAFAVRTPAPGTDLDGCTVTVHDRCCAGSTRPTTAAPRRWKRCCP